MTAAGGSSPHGLPLTDITSRMASIGRRAFEAAGIDDPAQIASAADVITLLRAHVPRTTQPEDTPIFDTDVSADTSYRRPLDRESAVFEGAAFLGEWLRTWVNAAWIVEGPFEPHLRLLASDSTITYFFPVVSVVRVASTAGYDGLAGLLETMIEDLRHPPRAGAPLAELRVTPPRDQARVLAWIKRWRAEQRNAHGPSPATLWRRCQACASLVEDTVTLPLTTASWERDATAAAGMLARRPFECACGGPAGEVSRFVMLRPHAASNLFADIFLGGTHTRVACWRIEGDTATAIDASALSLGALIG